MMKEQIKPCREPHQLKMMSKSGVFFLIIGPCIIYYNHVCDIYANIISPGKGLPF